MIGFKDFDQLRIFRFLRFKKDAVIVVENYGGTESVVPVPRRSLTQLTNTNLEALAATPIELIPAAPATKMHIVDGWRFRLIFNGDAQDDAAAAGNLILKYAGGSTIDSMEADGLVDAGANTQGLSRNLTELLVAESGVAGKAVQISNDGGEFANGDSTAEVEVFYHTVDVDPS